MTKTKSINERANTYLRNRVMTARPEELRMMLLEGAIRFGKQAREGLEMKNYERVYDGLTQCQSILLELVNGLDREQAPELCDRLSGLYTFMYNRSIDAGLERDPAIMDEVLELLEYERETWVMLMQKLSEERHGSDRPQHHESRDKTNDNKSAINSDGENKRSISVQG